MRDGPTQLGPIEKGMQLARMRGLEQTVRAVDLHPSPKHVICDERWSQIRCGRTRLPSQYLVKAPETGEQRGR
jgi:hypothetical protein